MTDAALRKVLLVGELNPFGADPRYALYHLPRASSGNRLRCIMGLTDLHYHSLFDKVNLCDGEWSPEEARVRLAELLASRAGVLVLLGAKVRDAARRLLRKRFETPAPLEFFTKFDVWDPWPVVYEPPREKLFVCSKLTHVLICLPHPSGLCRLWNEENSVARARKLLSAAAPWVPWGAAPDDGGSQNKVECPG